MIRKCLWSLVIVNITIDSILSVLSILCLISHIQTSDVVRQGHITARVDWRTDGLPGLEAIVGVALIMIRIKNKILKIIFLTNAWTKMDHRIYLVTLTLWGAGQIANLV